MRRFQPNLHPAAGFTMIEILVAITILTVMVGIVYGAFVSVANTAEIARTSAEELRFRQYLWRHFSTHLVAVYSDSAFERPEFQFLGESAEGLLGEADSLRFCTSLPMSGPKSLPGVVKVITYEIGDAYAPEGESGLEEMAIDEQLEEEGSGQYLIIREEPLVLEGVAMGGDIDGDMGGDLDLEQMEDEVIEQRIPVGSLDFEFYNPDTEEWDEDWDSTADARLPWAIRVKVNFDRTEEELMADLQEGFDLEENPDLNMTISLPMGAGVVEPFLDWNHMLQPEQPPPGGAGG